LVSSLIKAFSLFLVILSFFLNTQAVLADASEIRYEGFENFNSVIEKDYPTRKYPKYDYAPTVMKEGEVFKMWWLGRAEKPVPVLDRQEDNVFYAESKNGINWSKPISVLQPSHNDLGVYGYHVGNPSVIKVKSTYHMYFSSGNGSKTTLGVPIPGNAIGYTSSNDGIAWNGVKVIKEPFDPKNQCCGGYGAGEPSVIFLDDSFYMAYIDTTGKRSNSTNGSGIYVIRSPQADFSTDVEVFSGNGSFAPLTKDNETGYLWKDNTNGGEFAWSKQLNQFVLLRGGTSQLLFADRNLNIVQTLDLPSPKNGWREENTLSRTPEGHTLDLGLGNGIDMFVYGGYVTADASKDPKDWPGKTDIWWTDFQATKFILLEQDEPIGSRLAAKLKHANNDCPQGYQRVAFIGNVSAGADGYDFSDGAQNWALCSLKVQDTDQSAVIIKHVSNDCPSGYDRVAFLGSVYIGADGFGFDKPRDWAMCSLKEKDRNIVVLKHSSNDCPPGYMRFAWLGSVYAGADGFGFDKPRDWAMCTLVQTSR
jgi:hypothetical protein